MNAARQKEIEKAISLIEDAKSILDQCATDERESYDELSDKAKESSKGEALDASATALEESLDDCDSLITRLQDAKV